MIEEDPPKRNPYLWKPGQSGNPGGRPAIVRKVRELAQSHAPDAIEELARLAFNAEDERVRVAAIKELLDRGIGRAERQSAVMANVSLAATLQALAARAAEHRDTIAALRANIDPKLTALRAFND